MASSSNEAKRKPLELFDYQQPHFDRLQQILNVHTCAIDNSGTGRGKTILAYSLAKILNFKLVVVAPVTTHEAWRRVAEQYDVAAPVKIMGYESLRGTKSKSAEPKLLKHGLLQRSDTAGAVGGDQSKTPTTTTFEATDALRALIAEGVLIVFDEFHALKNQSVQNKAASTLSRLVRQSKSRCLFMSATPMDKVEHAIHFARLMGFITEKMLANFNVFATRMEPRGIEELRLAAHSIDAYATLRTLGSNWMSGEWRQQGLRQARAIAYDLFTKVILANISSAMPPHDVPRRVFRGFFNITTPEDRKLVKNGVADLCDATRFKDGEVDMRGGDTNFGAITLALMKIEEGLVADMCRVAFDKLKDEPMCKVILAVNYNKIKHKALLTLAAYGTAELSGEVDQSHRQAEIDRFNSSDACRVMVMTMTTGSIGINLHDIQGGRKRYMFITPDYKLISLHQCVGRIFRHGALTNGEAFIFYSQIEGGVASSIMSALGRKSNVVKSSLYGEENKEQHLPGEYPIHIEPSDDADAQARVAEILRLLETKKPAPMMPEPVQIDLTDDDPSQKRKLDEMAQAPRAKRPRLPIYGQTQSQPDLVARMIESMKATLARFGIQTIQK